MGCFLSTNKPTPSSKFQQHSSRFNRTPPPVDVETVKEVLSETPHQNPFIRIENDHKKIELRQNSYKFLQQDHIVDQNPIISDDEVDFDRRKVASRSPAKSRSRTQLSGELQPDRKSPVRRKEMSPGRVRHDLERNGYGTGFGSAGRQRLGSGNVSAARSRSPAKRTMAGGGNEIGRSLSCRRIGKSPGRVGSDLHERFRKPELRSDRDRGRGREESNRFSTTTNDESLDNPLVSLECFIFL